MMSFLNFDLAKLLTEERVGRAMTESARRQARRDRGEPGADGLSDEAEVIELSFGRGCETEQIGA